MNGPPTAPSDAEAALNQAIELKNYTEHNKNAYADGHAAANVVASGQDATFLGVLTAGLNEIKLKLDAGD